MVKILELNGRNLVNYAGEFAGSQERPRDLETQAAIKVLRVQAESSDPERFREEARTIAHLEHPHIVRVLEFGVENGFPFLVMTFAPGGTLRQRHPKGEQLPLMTIISYIEQIADALQYIHNKKLIHLDVKPENMLLGPGNDLLLSDFGIASIAHRATSLFEQSHAGTPPYIALEQIQGYPRPASDQYALGVVVYEWLCGRRPFDGPVLSIFYQHLYTPLPSLREQLPTISPPVEAVVLKALAKEPKQRFANVLSFATALNRAALLSDQSPPPLRPTLSTSHPLFLSPTDTNVSPNAVTEVD